MLDLAGGAGGVCDDDLSGNWCLEGGGSDGSSGGGGVSIMRGTGASFLGKELLLWTELVCGGCCCACGCVSESWLAIDDAMSFTEMSSALPSVLEPVGLV